MIAFSLAVGSIFVITGSCVALIFRSMQIRQKRERDHEQQQHR